jgi:hypothetical protein
MFRLNTVRFTTVSTLIGGGAVCAPYLAPNLDPLRVLYRVLLNAGLFGVEQTCRCCTATDCASVSQC